MKLIFVDYIVFLKFFFYWCSYLWEVFGLNFSFKICVLFCDEKWWEKDERFVCMYKNYYFEKKIIILNCMEKILKLCESYLNCGMGVFFYEFC